MKLENSWYVKMTSVVKAGRVQTKDDVSGNSPIL